MFNVGNVIHRTVIVAQLVEWSFPEPEIRSLDFARTRDPKFGFCHPQNYLLLPLLKGTIERKKIKKKRPGLAQFLTM